MPEKIGWQSIQTIHANSYRCGHCGNQVASEKGLQGHYHGTSPGAFVAICPECTFPTLLAGGIQVPRTRSGNDVAGIDDKTVLDLYNEARDCTGIGAFTAAVLCCRKILMHVAVAKGAKPGEAFIGYVEFLATKGYVPPDGRDWIDHIRATGNEANHEIVIATRESAEEVLSFVEMLLKFVYEFPYRVKARRQAP